MEEFLVEVLESLEVHRVRVIVKEKDKQEEMVVNMVEAQKEMVAGGGGYYGGYAMQSVGDNTNSSGAGGSGYIGGVSDGRTENGVREGNGYATISILDYIV